MGHGDHWEAIGGNIERTIARILPTVIAKGKLLSKASFTLRQPKRPVRTSTAVAIQHPRDTPLRYLALLADNKRFDRDEGHYLHSAYPYLAAGKIATIRVVRVRPWADTVEEAIEGQVDVDLIGARATFFDPLFYARKKVWVPEARVRVRLAGLAYSLCKAEQDSLVMTEGALIEEERRELLKKNPKANPNSIRQVTLLLKGMTSLLCGGSAPDNATFRCPVTAVRSFKVDKTEFKQIEVVLVRYEGKTARGMIYASERVLNGYVPAVGDDIEGVMWLQGAAVGKP